MNTEKRSSTPPRYGKCALCEGNRRHNGALCCCCNGTGHGDQYPEGDPVDTRPGYELYANGELWTTGEYAHRCGYLDDLRNIDAGIDAYKEEVAALTAEWKAYG